MSILMGMLAKQIMRHSELSPEAGRQKYRQLFAQTNEYFSIKPDVDRILIRCGSPSEFRGGHPHRDRAGAGVSSQLPVLSDQKGDRQNLFRAAAAHSHGAGAYMLLKNTALSVSDISLYLEYSNTSNFYKAFREYYHMNPTELKRVST